MGRHEMRWEELRWDDLRWSASVKCGVWGVKSAMWSVRKVLAWRCIAPGPRAGHVLGQQHCNSFAQSTHARAWLVHGAHKFSKYYWEVILESLDDIWEEMRWEEISWDKARRAQMRWSVECEECSVKCGAWRVQCEVWSVKWEVWSVKKAVRSEKCGLWSVKCEVWSLKSAVWSEAWSAKSAVWSVKCGVWRVQWEVRSAKWSFKCDMWDRTQLSQNERTHGLGWRTAHASSIDEKGLIYPQGNFRPASCGYYW